MAKWFIVVVADRCPVEGRDAITKYLKTTPHGWWHWMSTTWVIEGADDASTFLTLRDAINKLVGEQHFIVLEFSSDPRWAGLGPNKMFEWFRTE